jgi:hypothetical protein
MHPELFRAAGHAHPAVDPPLAAVIAAAIIATAFLWFLMRLMLRRPPQDADPAGRGTGPHDRQRS